MLGLVKNRTTQKGQSPKCYIVEEEDAKEAQMLENSFLSKCQKMSKTISRITSLWIVTTKKCLAQLANPGRTLAEQILQNSNLLRIN
jgi:hypothetical protein